MQKKFSLKEVRKAKESIVKRQPKSARSDKVAKNTEKSKLAKEQIKAQGTHPQRIPCPPKPCPPQEVDILRVTKVYQECRLVDTNELIDFPEEVPAGAVDVECLGAELIGVPICMINADQTVTATFSFVTAYQFLDSNGNPIGDVQVIQSDETRTVVLSRAGEDGLDCLVEIFLDCLLCFVSERDMEGNIIEVTCCVGKQIIFKLVADVELLIPTFGFAPVPPDCEQVLGECPDFNPVWPPFPPQNGTRPFNKRCGGCST